jgi:hypothetical protein
MLHFAGLFAAGCKNPNNAVRLGFGPIPTGQDCASFIFGAGEYTLQGAAGQTDWDLHFVDTSVIRAHQQAAGARRAGPIVG